MKRLLMIMSLTVAASGWACDLCNYYIGIMPHDYRNTIGFRYRYSSYAGMAETMLMAKAMHGGETAASKERFHTYEMWARYYPTQKLQLDVIVPFRHNCSGDETISGVGDLVVLTHYELFSTFPTGENPLQQKLSLGGGIKLPTGEFGHDDPHLQTGSGSTDFVLDGAYQMRYLNWGFYGNINYSITQKNSDAFQYSNRLNSSITAFHRTQFSDWSVMPSVGFQYEQAGMDRHEGVAVDHTGGKTILGQLGGEIFLKDIAVSIAYFHPLFQTAHQPKNNYRLALGMSYSFASNRL